MLIKKENTWRFFRDKGLQTSPEIFDEIDRQLQAGLSRIAERAVKDDIKRIGIADISLNGRQNHGETPVSPDNSGSITLPRFPGLVAAVSASMIV